MDSPILPGKEGLAVLAVIEYEGVVCSVPVHRNPSDRNEGMVYTAYLAREGIAGSTGFCLLASFYAAPSRRTHCLLRVWRANAAETFAGFPMRRQCGEYF